MSIKIVCAADTHGQNLTTKWEWPKADIFIHAGDMTSKGTPDQLAKVSREILSLGYRYNIVIAGNHDRGFWEQIGYGRGGWKLMPGIIILQDETIEVMGLRIYGSSWLKFKRGTYPFEVEHLHDKWDKIPDDTDVLVTHMPPKGILSKKWDGEEMGSGYLTKTLGERVLPKLHVFGHIHASYGVKKLWEDMPYPEGTTFVNAALVGEDRKPANKPIVVEIQ